MGGRLFAMVSEWMVNGNIIEFIEAHRDANRFKLVGLTPALTSPIADEITLDSSKALPGGAVYARRGDDTWRPEGGMNSSADCYSTA